MVAFRKHGSQQIVADALQSVYGRLYLVLVFMRNRVLHISQLARHFPDGDLALLFMFVRLDGIVASQLRKGHHVSQSGLRLPAVTGNVKSVGCTELQLGYVNAQNRTIGDAGVGDSSLEFAERGLFAAHHIRREDEHQDRNA